MQASIAVVVAALALALTGIMAGIFFTWSNAVMPGLDGAGAEHAIPAFQQMDRKIQNPVFQAAFLGAPAAAAVAGALLLGLGQRPAAILFFLAAAVYVLGVMLVTFTIHIPINNDLATVTVPSDPAAAAQLWTDFSARWTPWNTVRAGANTISLLLIGLGIFRWGS
jgi:uncharacterized membrane protein